MMKKLLTLFFALGVLASKAQVNNKAMVFSGTGTNAQGVSFANIAALNSVAQFTFEAWVYIDQWNTGSIFMQNSVAPTGQNRIGMQMGVLPNTTKVLYCYVGNNVNASLQVNSPNIDDGQWHHVAMVYDGSQSLNVDKIKVYIDGVQKTTGLVSNGTLPTTTPVTTTNPFMLGRDLFNGKIDEVRIWNVALTQSQLDYKNTINKYHPLYNNLITYWNMDDLPGGIVKDTKGSIDGTITGNASSVENVTNNSQFRYKVVSSYIRSNFYESGQIGSEAILNNNDLIYLTCSPYANGDLFFDYPINNGTLTNASYLSSFNSRSGIMSFGGNGAVMNCGKNLLNTATGGVTSFTFATWVYVDSWVENSYIFRKYSSDNSRIDIQLGAQATSTLYFHVANGANNYVQLNNSGLADGQWHHVAVTYSGGAGANNQVKLYIDGVSKTVTYANGDGLLPTAGPFIQSDFELGTNFAGKLDETSINLLSLSAGEINTIRNNPIVVSSWNQTKTSAYWKYDDANSPAKDYRTWVGVLNSLKTTVSGYGGVKLRLGVTNGAWTTMIQSSTARQNFANNIKNLVQEFELDGVDLDFEWATTTQQWADYSNTILALDAVLPSTSTFTVSLHPLYYQISSAAIAALDKVSIQCYGPNPNRYPYSQFVTDVNTVINYGYPSTKLIMGVPFYGTATANPSPSVTTSYSNIIANIPALDPSLDVATVPVSNVSTSITFNGQNTIKSKATYVRDLGLGGTMSWDLATDISYTNSLSLLRGVTAVTNANIGEAGSGPSRVLPVKLTLFTAKANASSVNLKWTTAFEQNASHFNVTRSLDGAKFTTIGRVAAINKANNYAYTDFYPTKGTNYYQLVQVDLDGETQNSEIVSAKIAVSEIDLKILSLTSDAVTVNIYSPKPISGKIAINNLLGQKMVSKTVYLQEGNNKLTIAAAQKSQVIIVTLATQEGTVSKKAIR